MDTMSTNTPLQSADIVYQAFLPLIKRFKHVLLWNQDKRLTLRVNDKNLTLRIQPTPPGELKTYVHPFKSTQLYLNSVITEDEQAIDLFYDELESFMIEIESGHVQSKVVR